MAPRWLVTGAGGKLGSHVLATLARRGAEAVGTVSASGPRPGLGRTLPADLADLDAAVALARAQRPRYLVHCAGVTTPGAAHADPAAAHRLNVELAGRLAELAAELGARLVFVSTDMVFDGEHAPYPEDATPAPGTVYGATKVRAERAIAEHANSVTVRMPLLYGFPAANRPSYFGSLVRGLQRGEPQDVFHDEVRTPLWLADAAVALVRAAEADVDGVVHAGGPESLSRLEMARCVASALGIERPALRVVSRLTMPGPEPRPRDLSLRSDRFTTTLSGPPGRPMREALHAMLATRTD
ncbi:MAG: SDR family oxidoreductase [Myxococcales bacterium]